MVLFWGNNLNWWKAATATAIAQVVHMIGGLVVTKVIAMYLGPEGFGRLGHFMSIIAILNTSAAGRVLIGIVMSFQPQFSFPFHECRATC